MGQLWHKERFKVKRPSKNSKTIWEKKWLWFYSEWFIFLDLTLTITIFGVPINLLSPDTGLFMLPWQLCSLCRFFFFFTCSFSLVRGSWKLLPSKLRLCRRMQSLFPESELHASDHAEGEGNKICFITHFYMRDLSRAISEAVRISKNSWVLWHCHPA